MLAVTYTINVHVPDDLDDELFNHLMDELPLPRHIGPVFLALCRRYGPGKDVPITVSVADDIGTENFRHDHED